MKQLLILSGKGGTGKTTIASAFIRLSDVKAYADCDVDAPNLHLIMAQHTEPERTDYIGALNADYAKKTVGSMQSLARTVIRLILLPVKAVGFVKLSALQTLFL